MDILIMLELTFEEANDCDLILAHLVEKGAFYNAIEIQNNILKNRDINYVSAIIEKISNCYPSIVKENSVANTYRFIGPNEKTKYFLENGGFAKKNKTD